MPQPVTRRPPARRPALWRRPRLPFRPIVAGFLLAGAALTTIVAWPLAGRLHWPLLVAYLAGVNVATFVAYAYDKSVARADVVQRIRFWRVPESTLHLMTLGGGTAGAFAGQRVLRHKTMKQPFRAWFWGIAALQFALLSLWIWHTRTLA
jgi:uncharacterized membrane protein YsdA (DUF1294 family)